MSILDSQTETASRQDILQRQLERLQATINRAYRHVRYYRQAYDDAGVIPEDIRTLDDLPRLPFTTRDDLLDHQPYDLFAVPLRDVLRLHPAAGAGGPVVVGYTRNDIQVWTRMAARALASAGVTKYDVVQICLDYSLGAAAMGAQSGAEVIGASVIPCSGLSPERQVDVMRHYRATVLVATPSQALQLGRVVPDTAPASLTLRTAFIVGEVWSDDLRSKIEKALRVEAFGSYGLTEMAVPGLATECECHAGLHISEDNVLAEVVDPSTHKNLPPGETGELVLTTLSREGVPLLRYRTGDLTALHDTKCQCGRTMMRIDPTHARTDNVVIVEGVRVSPRQVQDLAREIIPGSDCDIAVIEQDERECLEIRIGVDASQFGDEMRQLQDLRQHTETVFHEHLGVRSAVRLVEPGRIHKKK